jgi:N utilization substance protein B
VSARPKSSPPEPRRSPQKRGGRTAARIAAVQALYQIDMSRGDPGAVIAEFRDHRLGQGGQSAKGRGAPDANFFADVVARAALRREEIDGLVRSALAEDWKLERLDAVLRALLRAGVAELLEAGEVPAPVVIDEYVQVAHAFFAAREAGFVNGILHRLAHRLRPAELASASGGGADDGRQTER